MTRLVFVDCETTGLDPERHHIWEIAWLVRDPDLTGNTDDINHWMIRPDLSTADPNALAIGRYYERIGKLATQPVGTTQIMVEVDGALKVNGNPPLTQLAADLANDLDGAFVVGNVPWFDERFIQNLLRANGQCLASHYHLVDIEAMAVGQLGTGHLLPPFDSATINASYGLDYPPGARHTALGDARMVRDLYDAILNRAAKDAATRLDQEAAALFPPRAMPTFTILAKDAIAPETLAAYRDLCSRFGLIDQAREVQKALEEIADWQKANPTEVKMPDHQHQPHR
jgi:DNA polymerase III epsilon subunit-like protein